MSETHRTLTIRTDGTIDVAETDGRPTLDQLQEWVGGWVEAIDLVVDEAADAVVWIDEEGKFGKSRNALATRLVRHYGAIFSDDHVAGDVAITGPVDAEGETTDLDVATISEILGVLTGPEREPLRAAPSFWESVAEVVYAGVPVVAAVPPEPLEPSTFTLTIALGNAAFSDTNPDGAGLRLELASCLDAVLQTVKYDGAVEGSILDSNGNTVGSWALR